MLRKTTLLKISGIFIGVIILGWVSYGIIQDSMAVRGSTVRLEKVFEMNDITLTGYKDGKTNWRVLANYVWSGRNRYEAQADSIHDGMVYDAAGVTVMQNLSADHIEVRLHSRQFRAYGQIYGEFIRHFYEKGRAKVDTIQLHAGEVNYYEISGRTYFRKDVKVNQGVAQITAQEILLENDTHVAFIDNDFTVKTEDFTVRGNHLVMNIDDNIVEIVGHVTAQLPGKKLNDATRDEREARLKRLDTNLSCDYLKLTAKNNALQLYLEGNIQLQQPDKLITTQKGTYHKEGDYFHLENGVTIKCQDLNWLLSRSQIEKLSNRDIKKIIQKPSTISADSADFYAKDQSFELLNNVRFEQDDLVVTCRRATYKGSTQRLEFFGDVEIIREGQEKISGQYGVFDISLGTLAAERGVKANVLIKD